ncbi:MAG: hypothetical protein LBS15_03695 [Endomicrobium sp.]|nr:hypothetical protein [Endomicrobium sp.]
MLKEILSEVLRVYVLVKGEDCELFGIIAKKYVKKVCGFFKRNQQQIL